MSIQDVFNFMVANLVAMGLELNLHDSLITTGSQKGGRP